MNIAVFIDPVSKLQRLELYKSTCLHVYKIILNTQKRCTTANKIHNSGIDFVYHVLVVSRFSLRILPTITFLYLRVSLSQLMLSLLLLLRSQERVFSHSSESSQSYLYCCVLLASKCWSVLLFLGAAIIRTNGRLDH